MVRLDDDLGLPLTRYASVQDSRWRGDVRGVPAPLAQIRFKRLRRRTRTFVLSFAVFAVTACEATGHPVVGRDNIDERVSN